MVSGWEASSKLTRRPLGNSDGINEVFWPIKCIWVEPNLTVGLRADAADSTWPKTVLSTGHKGNHASLKFLKEGFG